MPRKHFPPSIKGGQRITLKRRQLDSLATESKLTLSPAQEAHLQELCANYLINSRLEQQSTRASLASRLYEKLAGELERLIESLANIMGKETPHHHAVHVEIEDQLQRRGSDISFELHRFMHFQRIVITARNEHTSQFGGRGRPMKNESQREFIWHLADLFEGAGGKAGVTYRSIDNSLRSPFLTWVANINGYLPKRIQVQPTALPDLVREICRLRNTKRASAKRSREAGRAVKRNGSLKKRPVRHLDP